jgi:hypothetical protein
MNPNTNTNYLTNSLSKAQQFVGQAVAKVQGNIERTPWGYYKNIQGPTSNLVGEQLKNVKAAAEVKQTQGVYPSGSYSSVTPGERQEFKVPTAAPVIANIPADVLTNTTRRDVWKYTNMHRLMSDVGQHVGPRLGLESTLAGAAVAAAVPVALGMMSGQVGSITEGLRPKGYKAVAPVSKEEDPTGRKTRSAALEAAMRYGLGQKSQLLPYQEFKQERPGVAPSTFSQYRRYQTLKPKPGKNVIIDPESQSFSALGGVIRGTARGLNDPEISLKGVPITASAVLGTAAGLGAIKALTYAAEPKLKIEPAKADAQGNYNLEQKQYPGFANVKISGQQGLGVKIAEKLGGYTEPAILAAGAVTAAAVGHAAKKLFQKSAERRIKKENPVEYLKHKHGSLEQASTALGQPQAQSWQQLVPHIK